MTKNIGGYKDETYTLFSLKGPKNPRPLKRQVKCWTVDNINPIPYKTEEMMLGGFSDLWLGVFAHANFNKTPRIAWPDSEGNQSLVLHSLNTFAPKNGLFSTLVLALAHNRDRRLTEYHRLKSHAISVDGLPWTKEILRTFLYLLNRYQQIIWRYSDPSKALQSIDLLDFVDFVAKGTAKRVYTETLKQILLHLLIIQDTRITVRLVDKTGNAKNAIFGGLLTSHVLQFATTTSTQFASQVLGDLLDNPGDVGVRRRIRKAGIRINLLDSAIDKIQRSAFVRFTYPLNGGAPTPVYRSQIFTMPLPINIKKMDEYRLFALLSAFTNKKNQEFVSRSFNFETVAAIVGRSADIIHDTKQNIFALAAKVLPLFCPVWGYDGKAFSFLMERYSDQHFDYKAICQKKRAESIAVFAASVSDPNLKIGNYPSKTRLTVDPGNFKNLTVDPGEIPTAVTVDPGGNTHRRDGRSREHFTAVTVDPGEKVTPSSDTKGKSSLGKNSRKDMKIGKNSNRKESEQNQNSRQRFSSIEDLVKNWPDASTRFKDDFMATEDVSVAPEAYESFFRLGPQNATKHPLLNDVAKRFMTFCSRAEKV